MLLLLLACNGKDDSSGADDSSTPGGRRFAGTIVDHTTGDPIPDADICLFAENTCGQTSADGAFTLFSDRPNDEEFALLAAEPGWVALTVPYTVPEGDAPAGVFEMWSVDLAPDHAKSATLLVTTVDASGSPRTGVTISVEGATDVTTGTSGEALFTELADDGSATITTSASCTGVYAWEALEDGAFRANLETGRFFSTRLRCE